MTLQTNFISGAVVARVVGKPVVAGLAATIESERFLTSDSEAEPTRVRVVHFYDYNNVLYKN